MRASRLVLAGVLGVAVLAAPIVGEAQPALEELRFDPPQLCLRDLFRWGFSYRGLPGGLAAVKDIELSALFAPCYYAFVGGEAVIDRPIRLFHGAADDLAPVALCRAYVERLREAGADAQITEYAGACHQFVRPDGGPARHNPREQNASHCFWEERPEGQLVGRDSGQPFSLGDPCVVLGGTFGADPAAYRDGLKAVKALVGAPARPAP